MHMDGVYMYVRIYAHVMCMSNGGISHCRLHGNTYMVCNIYCVYCRTGSSLALFCYFLNNILCTIYTFIGEDSEEEEEDAYMYSVGMSVDEMLHQRELKKDAHRSACIYVSVRGWVTDVSRYMHVHNFRAHYNLSLC